MNLTLFELLCEALNSKYGIVVSSPDPKRLQQRLRYEKQKDEDFAELTFHLSPTNPEKELWIVKGKTDE